MVTGDHGVHSLLAPLQGDKKETPATRSTSILHARPTEAREPTRIPKTPNRQWGNWEELTYPIAATSESFLPQPSRDWLMQSVSALATPSGLCTCCDKRWCAREFVCDHKRLRNVLAPGRTASALPDHAHRTYMRECTCFQYQISERIFTEGTGAHSPIHSLPCL